MEIDYEYWEHQRPGLEKTACAWLIFFALVLLFGAAGLV
jgi:hypothetical protein